MNRNLFFPTAILLCLGMILSTGCRKLVHQNIQAASNGSLALRSFNDVFIQINRSVSSEMALDEMTSANWNLQGSLCATVNLNPVGTGFPKTLTIDYGTGCTGPEGVTRKGKIIVVFSGNFRAEGTTMEVTLDGYSTGQYSLTGTYDIANDGLNGSGQPLFGEVVSNATISWGTQMVAWEAELTRTWIEGDTTNYSTPDTTSIMGFAGLNDDVFTLSGTAVGNDSNTHPFTLETTNAVVLPASCKYITEGMLVISPVNFNAGTVDYGMGDCDKRATIEVDGEVFNFTQ